MKSPPVQMRDDEARIALDDFIEDKGLAMSSDGEPVPPKRAL